MLKSPQITILKELVNSLSKIVSSELKKSIKFPEGDLQTDSIQRVADAMCNFNSQISMSCS
jgi:hypothetical protein